MTTQSELAAVWGAFGALYNLSERGIPWVAASDSAVEGVWRWVAGPEAGQLVDASLWAAGEPNNVGDEDYAVLHWQRGNGLFFDVRNTRQVLSLLGSYAVRDDLTLLVGGENTRDNVHTAEAASPFINGSVDIKYHSNALFSQLEWESETVSLALGARYENHSAFDPSFVPRLAADVRNGIGRSLGCFAVWEDHHSNDEKRG